MEHNTHQSIKIILIGLMITMISLPLEAQRTRKHYAEKVKNRNYYASINKTPRVNNVANNRYLYRKNKVRRRPQVAITRPVVTPVCQNLRTTPRDAIRFRAQNQNFYYSYGNFYRETNFGLRTIPTPLGAQIGFLPQRANRVLYRGNVLYQLDYLLLESRINRRGRIVYQVVGQV